MGVIRDIISKFQDISSISNKAENPEFDYSTGTGLGYRSVGAKIEYALDPVYDEYFDREVLVARSRQMEFDSPVYASMIYWLSTYVIGAGLNLNIQPQWDILGITDESKKEYYQNLIEHRINNILKSKEVDYKGNYHTGQFFRDLYKTYLVDGDVFVQFIYEHKKSKNDFQLCPVKLAIIPTQCVNGFIEGGNSSDGVVLDKTGKVVGYMVNTFNLYDTSSDEVPKLKNFYLSKYSQNNQLQVVHLANRNRMWDLRGIPKATSLFHEFNKIKQALLAELEAQGLNAQILGYIERDVDTPVMSNFNVAGGNNKCNKLGDKPKTDGSIWNTTNIVVNSLNPGEKFSQMATNRPNLNIPEFIDNVLTPVCSAYGIPKEVLKASYNSNYSASRASINQFWKSVIQDRADFILNFASPFYESLITELVYAGDLQLEGFLEDSNKRLAWLNHNWVGSAIPTLDPTKEVNALETAINNGLITRTEASQHLYGSNYRNNISGLADENNYAKKLGVKFKDNPNFIEEEVIE